MNSPIQAFPLCWPQGWVRTHPAFRKPGRFNRGERQYSSSPDGGSWLRKRDVTVSDGITRILGELERMGIDRQDIVISTNVRTRLDGLPRSGEREPDDPGAAVYWQDTDGNRRRRMAIDVYTRVADNLAAIAATLDAMRAIERHGGAEILDRAFTGFVALPSPEQPWQVLGVQMSASRSEIEQAYRRLAMQHHPDRGGNQDEMARINAAREAMMERTAA
jgi:hypothetical protein